MQVLANRANAVWVEKQLQMKKPEKERRASNEAGDGGTAAAAGHSKGIGGWIRPAVLDARGLSAGGVDMQGYLRMVPDLLKGGKIAVQLTYLGEDQVVEDASATAAQATGDAMAYLLGGEAELAAGGNSGEDPASSFSSGGGPPLGPQASVASSVGSAGVGGEEEGGGGSVREAAIKVDLWAAIARLYPTKIPTGLRVSGLTLLDRHVLQTITNVEKVRGMIGKGRGLTCV